MSLYSRLDRIAADVEKLNRQVNSVANAPQSQRTSVEGGSIDFNDADGNLKAIVGEQEDGGNTVNVIAGPTPPTPTNFTVTVDHGSLTVHWDGEFEDGAVAPTDWARWTAYAQSGQFVVPDRSTSIGGTDSASGGEVTAGVLKGEWTVTLLAWSQAGKPSAMATPVTVDVPGYGDIVLAEIDAAETVIKNAGEVLVTEQGTLDEKLTEVDGTLNDLGQDLAAVEDAQAQLNTDLEDVMTSVDGKNTITWNPSAPSAVSTPGMAVGDLWYRTSGNSIVGFWKWDGTDWVTQLLDVTTIPLIDIGAGTFGTLKGARLEANTVTADKVLIGKGGSLIPWSLTTTAPHQSLNGNVASIVDDPNIGPAVQVTGTTLATWTEGIRFYKDSESFVTACVPSTPYVFSLSVGGSGSAPAGGWRLRLAVYWYNAAGSMFSSEASSAFTNVVPGEVRDFSYQANSPVGAYGIRVALQIMGPIGSAKLLVKDVWLKEQTGSTLITNGGITTPKLAADVLEVRNLKATTGQLDEAVINKLFSDVVVAKTAVANAFIGENAILTGAVTAPKITASEELWAKIAQFVKIRAEHIESDAIDGMVITGPNIRTAASGARVQMDPNGIRVFNADDDVRTHLSPDGSTFKGEVEAETLVVNDGAEFKGNNTLAQGSSLLLAAGVTDPTAPPTVQPYWEGVEFTPPNLLNGSLVGLAFDGTNYWTTAGSWYEITPPNNQIFRVNGSTGAVTGFQFPVSGANERFGVTCIGSELFWLYRSGYEGRILVTDFNCVKKREMPWNIGYSKTSPLTYKPGIGNDGTNLVIAHCTDAGRLDIHTCNKTTGAIISTVYDSADLTRSDITGVYVGNADRGRKLVTVAKKSAGELPSFNPTSGVYDGAVTKFSAASPDSVGVVYVDGKFRTLDPTGVIHEYANNYTGDGSGDWWATYYWYTDVDNDNVIESSDYRSRMAPPARFVWPRRAMLKILGQPMPEGVEALGPALAKKTSTPTRTDFHGPGWSVDEGKPSARYTELPTNWTTFASPSDTNTFPEAEPSTLRSSSSTFELKGTGEGRWGQIEFDRFGRVRGLTVSGTVSQPNVPPGGGMVSNTVTFPAGRFAVPPVVIAQADNGAVNALARNVTAESFELRSWNFSEGYTAVNNIVTWTAIGGST